MDKALMVLDMQEMYVGSGRDKNEYSYPVDMLIKNVNIRIQAYEPEAVIYVKSIKKGLFGGGMPKAGSADADLVRNLKVVSKNIFEKNKPDAFASDEIYQFVRARGIKELELVGVDGGGSVGNTAIGATEDCDLKIIFCEPAIGTINGEKAQKCREKIKKTRMTSTFDV